MSIPRIATGCVPLNQFGNGPISQAAYNYAFGFLNENLNYKQQVLALNVVGRSVRRLRCRRDPVCHRC